MVVLKKKLKIKKEPVWKGPEIDGITQSLLSRFLVCRERFRILVIEGWKPAAKFEPKIHYGNMWHTCEEALAANIMYTRPLQDYCKQLCREFPMEQNQIDKWYNVCLKQFPIYVDYWKKHPDVKNRTPIFQEQTFRVPYELPSGRTVILRGKWDSVDLIGKGKNAGIFLQENKTKSEVDEIKLGRQLTFDLQTMMYLIALQEYSTKPDNEFVAGQQIKGVRYNVVRRPLSGGKGSIRQHKPTKSNPQGESKSEYYERLQQYFIDSPQDYFSRWSVEITSGDIQRFKNEFFDPCLEHLCYWYDWITNHPNTPELFSHEHYRFLHYRLPYGIWNSVMERGTSDVEEYLLTGSTVGLQRVETLFPELD